jgi:hypothetical protein
MDHLVQWSKTATPEQKRAAAVSIPSSSDSDRRNSLSYEDVKALTEKPLQNSMVAFIEAEAPLLSRLDLAMFTSDQDAFITSDAPCVWFDPEGYKRPPFYQAPALMYESIEITFPISPRQILLLNRCGATGYFPAFAKLVDEFNRRTRFRCSEFFVNNRNEARATWFDPGVEPEDSWRKQHASDKTYMDEESS